MTNNWIKCSERMPGEGRKIWLTVRAIQDGRREVIHCFSEQLQESFRWCMPIAWQPYYAPEPYEGEE
jgi:hypothetical protein